jgi:hypothetical protein
MAISPTSLKALLAAEKADTLSVSTDKLSGERSRALDYYNSDVSADMPVAEGRSSAVSSDVLDTIEGLMPSLMEIFTGGDEVVKFEPVGQEDEAAAEQETDYVNHVFMQKNPGFLVLYSFIKDALLSKIGVVKVFWHEYEKEERETYLDQPDDVFAALVANPDVEIVEHTERDIELPPEMMAAMPMPPEGMGKLHDVTLVQRKTVGCAKAEAVPPEEFGISKRARSIAESHYCYHEVIKTQSELIEDGYDEAQVDTLPSAGLSNEQEELSRNSVEEGDTEANSVNRAMRPIKVVEHYVKMDYDGTGPRLYKATTGGDESEVLKKDGKLDVEPFDVMPFAAMTPVIITHRFFGKSIADLVMDIQRIKTALIRSLLDNVYLLNNQRVEVPETHAHDRTLDDLLVNRPGGIVRTKMPGGIIPIPNQPLGTAIYPAIEYMDATREWRTGVTRQGQGLNPDSLQNIGERAVLDQASSARAKTKLIARIFAETGIRDMFSLLHQVIRKNDDKQNTVRLRNKWVQVDPRQWKTRDDMTINVGLGTGTKEQELMFLMQLLQIQEKAIMIPGQNLVKPKNIYNTTAKVVDRMGLKSVEPYFSDPEAPDNPPPPPQPDPETMKLQMQAQLDEKADQRKAQIEQVQAQSDIATNQQKVQADIARDEREHQLKKDLAMMQAQIDMAKFEREEARKDKEHAQKMQLEGEQHSSNLEVMGLKARQKQDGEREVVSSEDIRMEKYDQALSGLGEVIGGLRDAFTGLAQKKSPQRRAVKQKDGSWTTEDMDAG